MKKLLIRTVNGQKTEKIPLWIMRQAGRILPEYREIAAKHSFLEMVQQPELAAEISLQPIKRFDMDGVILFSDILTPLIPLGMDLQYIDGTGPVFIDPINSYARAEKLKPLDPENHLGYVKDALEIINREVGHEKSLLGFCGSPFTLAAFMVEGKSVRNYSNLFKFMYEDENRFLSFLDFLADQMIEYLHFKANAGAEVLQVFESIGGILALEPFKKLALPSLKKLIQGVQKINVPCILYILNGQHLLDIYKECNADIAALDWRVDLSTAKSELPEDTVLQGNLNPSILMADQEIVKTEVLKVLDSLHLNATDGFQNHIFNLGHGILPDIPLSSVEVLVETVRSYRV